MRTRRRASWFCARRLLELQSHHIMIAEGLPISPRTPASQVDSASNSLPSADRSPIPRPNLPAPGALDVGAARAQYHALTLIIEVAGRPRVGIYYIGTFQVDLWAFAMYFDSTDPPAPFASRAHLESSPDVARAERRILS